MFTIKVSRACKSYQEGSTSNVIFEDFSVKVRQGTIYALMGSSGCGKTTLISCLIGIKSLDSGEIEIFGEPPGVNKTRIGYMPQESALINDLTVREMIWFFGTIYGLSSDKIKERFRFVSDLLELPDEDRLLKDCSGGETRRVSFALTLVHEPELLILDEPTVGVDPLLRSKIWDYLLELTTTKHVTVVLSTHYIEEAKQSTYVGIIRNGVRLIEDTPRNILQMTETTNLEEAFLKLSEKQEQGLSHQNFDDAVTSTSLMMNDSKNTFLTQQSPWTILKALLLKNLLKSSRDPHLIFIMFLIPVIGCLGLHFGIGGKIKNLSIGIVNEEVNTIEECFNRSLVTGYIQGFQCKLNKVSCRFIDELGYDIVAKKFYKTFDEAFEATKRGEIIGFLHFLPNFTETLRLFNDDIVDNDIHDTGSVHVFLDQSNFQITSFLQKKFYEVYTKFSENLLADCGKSKRAGNIPMVFEPAFGSINFSFVTTLVPGFLLSATFALCSFLTCLSIVTARLDGTWNRTIAAGAKPLHYFLSHLLQGLILMPIAFLEYLCYAVFFLSPSISWNSSILMSLLLFLTGVAGVLFGLLLSIITKTVMASFVLAQLFVYPVAFISGIIWPFEALPSMLKNIGIMFPFALPTIAYRFILVKGSSICDQTVYTAFIVLSSWIIIELLLCLWLIDKEDTNKIKKR